MARPRKANRQLPQYCYRDAHNGAYYLLLPANADGKRKRKTYGADLHRMMADWADLYGGDAVIGDTLNNTFDRYLGELARKRAKGDIRESTERDYHKYVSSLRRVWGHVRWQDFDAPAIAKWQEARAAMSVVQCNRELTILAQLAKLAGRLGLLRDNPMRFIDRLREKPRDRFVTDAEFAAVFKRASLAVRAAMFIASITGLRQGDILRLRRTDFGDEWLTVRTSKTSKTLQIAMTPGLRQAYEMGIGVRKFAALHWLVNRDGAAYTSSGFRSLWDRALRGAVDDSRANPDDAKSATLARFTFNDLRAKAGSEARDWQLLGHLDQRTFERVYNRLPRRVEPVR